MSSNLDPYLPDAKAALEGFLQTLLGEATVTLQEPVETTPEDVMPDSIGYAIIVGAAGPQNGFAVLVQDEVIPILSEAMLGAAMTMDEEGTDDLVRELAAQGYGSVRNLLAGEGLILPDVTYEVLAPGNLLPDENLPEQVYRVPFTFDIKGQTIGGFALIPIVEVAAPAEEAAPPPQAAPPAAAAPAAPAGPQAPAQQVPVSSASFPDLGNERQFMPGLENTNFHLLAEVELEVTVELGRRRLPLAGILALTSGSVIELEKLVGEPLQVYANGRLIAEGEAVVIDEQFGVRITNLASAKQRARAFM
ncbi:MAG: flagellar motor switch protein FliN [Bacteroidota bacterium]